MSEKDKNQQEEKVVSRRNFLKNASFTVGGLAVGAGVTGLFGGSKEKVKETTVKTENHTMVNHNQALMYFNQEQLQTIEEAAEQIFPKTEVGPGAKELLVGYFIDHQMAGNWGLNTKEYMSGPFAPSEAVPEQGYQTHLKRQEIFDLGIIALNTEALTRFKKKFYELEKDEEKIEILKDFEADKVKLNGAVKASFFFALLRKATIDGVYADPLYGGNANMEGWKMKNFPGHQASYTSILEKDEFVKIEPQSLNSQHKH